MTSSAARIGVVPSASRQTPRAESVGGDLDEGSRGEVPADTGERERIGWHEAGHYIGNLLVGSNPGVVSIAETRQWAGVHIASAELNSEALQEAFEMTDFSLPLACWDPRLRRYYELSAVTAACGPVAERMRPQERPSGYVPPSADERVIEEATELTRDEKRWLADGNSDADPSATDAEKIARAAQFLMPDWPHIFVELVWRDADKLMRKWPASVMLPALARELIEHTTLSADDARHVVEHVIRRRNHERVA